MDTASWKVTTNRSVVDCSSKKADWTADDLGQYSVYNCDNCGKLPSRNSGVNMLKHCPIIHDEVTKHHGFDVSSVYRNNASIKV